MKKTTFLFAVGAMLFTACTSSDVIEEGSNGSVIGFSSHVGKATKALNSVSDLTDFQVFGSYKLSTSSNRVVNFNGVSVTKSDAEWKYEDLRYWIKDAEYVFYAYSNDNASLGSGEGTADFGSEKCILNINNYTADASHQKDLVFAKSSAITGLETGNQPVAFTFKHALARLKATFKSGFPVGYTVKISNVKINGLYITGSYRAEQMADDHAWSINDAKTTGNVGLKVATDNGAKVKDGTTEAVNVESGWAYVIPNDYGTQNIVSIEFSIDVTNPEGKTVVGRTLKANWAPKWYANHSYNYNLTISGSNSGLEPIKFTVTSIGDWEEGAPTLTDFDLGASFVEK